MEESQTFKAPVGCNHCNQSGYRGRIGVHEILIIDDAMSEALRRNDQDGFVQAARAAKHYTPLSMSALERARQGVTSLDEVLRVSEGA